MSDTPHLKGLHNLGKWVARAVHRHDHPRGRWEEMPEQQRELYRRRADAAMTVVTPVIQGAVLSAYYRARRDAHEGAALRLRASGEHQAAETLDRMAAELEQSELAKIVHASDEAKGR